MPLSPQHASDTHISPITLSQLVFVDLETGGLDCQLHDILEIAAKHYESGESFQVYCQPERRVSPGSTEITGLSVIVSQLCLDGQPLPNVVSLKRGIAEFVNFLKSVADKLNGAPVFLVAHNAPFDASFLKHALKSLSLELEPYLTRFIAEKVGGFIDTLDMSRRHLRTAPRHRLQDLVKHFTPKLDNEPRPHSAVSDVEGLISVFTHALKPVAKLEDFVFSKSLV